MRVSFPNTRGVDTCFLTLDLVRYCERALLATFGFNLDAEVPQALIPKYVNAMGLTKENGFTKGNELITNAVRIANSVGGSTLCLEYPAPTIACAMIQSAVTQMAIEVRDVPRSLVSLCTRADVALWPQLPHSSSGKPWYETVTVTLRDKAGMKDQLGGASTLYTFCPSPTAIIVMTNLTLDWQSPQQLSCSEPRTL